MKLPARTPAVLLAIVAAALFSQPAAGQTSTWVGGTGSWNVPDNWADGIVPLSTTNADIDSGTAQLGSTGTFAANNVYIGDASTGAFSLGGANLSDATVTIGYALHSSGMVTMTGGTWNTSGSFTIGGTGNGSLILSAGTIQDNSTVLGSGSSSSGALDVTGGTFISGPSNMYVGLSGTGDVTVNGGTVVSGSGNNPLVSFGYNAGSSGTLTITSGEWNDGSGGDVHFGDSGSGDLIMTGGYFTSYSTRFGYLTGGVGTGVISGGTLNDVGYLAVGGGGENAQFVYSNGGTGALLVDGGYVSTQNTVLGDYAGASGTLTITSGSLITSGTVEVGNRSVGVLNIYGGLVTSGSNAIVGNTDLSIFDVYGNASGTMTVSGGTFTGSANLMVGSTSGTTSGSGVLNVTGGYVSDINGILGTGIAAGNTGGSALATVSSGTWFNSGTLIVGGQYSTGGTMNINGGFVSSAVGEIGATGSGTSGLGYTSTLNVSSGTWMTGSLVLGNLGSGVLTITGGLVSVRSGSGSVDLESGTGGNTVLNIDGGVLQASAVIGAAQSANTVNFNLTGTNVFLPGLNGSLTVNVNGSETLIVPAVSYSGSTNINGGVLQTGTGESLPGGGLMSGTIVDNGQYVIDYLNSMTVPAGISGTGSLEVLDGRVSLIGTNTYSGGTIINTGTVTVVSISHPGANLVIGENSGDVGDVTVTGSISDLSAILGSGSGAVGSGSMSLGVWNNAGGVNIGVSGTGTLMVENTAVMNVASGTGTIVLASGSGSAGTLDVGTLSSGSTVGTVNAAVVTGGSGAAAVVFNTPAGVGGTFQPLLEGSVAVTQSGSGSMTLNGTNNYTGATTVTGGTLAVNGSILNSTASVSGGVLTGSGATGNVNVSGSGLLAGNLSSQAVVVNSGGTMSAGNGAPGSNSATSLNVGAGATYQVTITAPNGGSYSGPGNHPVAGSDYSQSILTGTGAVLTLNSTAGSGSILELNLSGSLPPGGIGVIGSTYNALSANSTLDNYFILGLGSMTATISGQFAQASLDGGTPVNIDYSEGNLVGGANGDGSFAFDGQDWVISYDGNAASNSTDGGNAVVLTAVQEVPAFPRPWIAMLSIGAAGVVMLARQRRAA